jgi:CheY-like chemotaxis protein
LPIIALAGSAGVSGLSKTRGGSRASMEKSVLIIDDDKWIVMSTQMWLESEGFKVMTALTGADGQQTAKAGRPSIILLDIMMPGIDGWETLERLKSDPATADIPVIIFTGRESQQGESKSKEMGAVAYLRKPFRPELIVETIRAAIEARAAVAH